VTRTTQWAAPKRIIWIRSSKTDLKTFPRQVQSKIGYALWIAQAGGKHPEAKPLHGFGGAGVVEMIADFDGDTYRAVYTVRFRDAIYVLHVFKKKSRKGATTPRAEIELIKARLKFAETVHDELRKKGGDN
jgi:phage-related protein